MDPQSPGWPPSLHSSSLGSLGRRQWSNTRQALREQKHETSMPSLFSYCLWDTGEHKWRVGRTTRMVARDGHPSTRKIIRSARTLLPTRGIRHSPSRGKEYRATEWSEQAEKSQARPELLSQVAEISPEKKKIKISCASKSDRWEIRGWWNQEVKPHPAIFAKESRPFHDNYKIMSFLKSFSNIISMISLSCFPFLWDWSSSLHP